MIRQVNNYQMTCAVLAYGRAKLFRKGYMAEKKEWPLNSPMDVAEALDWVRRRMNGTGLLLVALSPNSVAFAADPQLRSADAVQMLRGVADYDIGSGIDRIKAQRITRSCVRRSQ